MTANANPILVEVTRGGTVESRHSGAVCVADADGRIVFARGDVDAIMCPRSAFKPMQALPLVESGAADAFAVTEAELALATASHVGEPVHIAGVRAWLERLQLSEHDLGCGGHPPVDAKATEALYRSGGAVTALHNNCSGKHTGFLTVAKHLGAPLAGYLSPDHPVQQSVRAAIVDLAGANTLRLPPVTDGCSAPNYFLPLAAFARGLARYPSRPGASRLLAAMNAHPQLVGGSGRECGAFIKTLTGLGVAKIGAEGVYGAILPDQGLGVAVKIDDGHMRAPAVALAAILKEIGAFKDGTGDAVDRLLRLPVLSVKGTTVGEIRAVT